MVREETFGPVSPIITFSTGDEAIRASVNGTAYGLSSAVCTNRLDDIITLRARSCTWAPVNVREVPGYRLELTPFGGIKTRLGYKRRRAGVRRASPTQDLLAAPGEPPRRPG